MQNIQKNTAVFVILLAMVLFACKRNDRVAITTADSLKIRQYEWQSDYYQSRNPDSAVYFAELGLKLAKQQQFLPGEALLYGRLAAINEHYGNLRLAARYQREALEWYKSLRDDSSIARTTANLGELEGKLGDNAGGTKLLKEAAGLDEQRHDLRAAARDYTWLGELEERLGDTNSAIGYYQRAELLSAKLPVNEGYYELLAKLGKMHTKNGNHQEALKVFQSGIAKSIASGHGKQEVIHLRHAAVAYDSLGDKEKAIAFHQQSLSRARELQLPEEEARSLMGIASAIKEQDAAQSIIHLKNALKIAHSIGHKQLVSEIDSSLARLYQQLSRYDEAMASLESHHKLVDSLKYVNAGNRIAVLQGSYALAESKLRVESLELTNDKRTAQRNVLLLSAIGIFLLLLLFAFYLYRTRQLNRQLASSNEVKDKLFSIIGHDLRNPIGGITQLLAMMEDGQLTPDEHQEMIIEMRKQGDITLEILNALLNWGEAQLKGVHVKNATFNAAEVINRNSSVLHKQAADKSLTIINTVSAALQVHADPNHFDFVIRNLISNAIKFSYKGGTIEISSSPGENHQVVFSVRDHGKGISREQLDRFAETNMEISSGTGGEKGTGIGLMLSREFIAANHGKLWVESEEGKGAEFKFTVKGAAE